MFGALEWAMGETGEESMGAFARSFAKAPSSCSALASARLRASLSTCLAAASEAYTEADGLLDPPRKNQKTARMTPAVITIPTKGIDNERIALF